MPDVKIKKSVLQSIIKKSLSESGPKGTHDVSQRLTVGPERSSLPSSLPLSPSDRMSTQLDVERPPVEDPEYVPANSRELGYALQALAEMVPAEQVDKAYMAFQKIIERLEDEGSDDEEVQLESIMRKNRILQALMNEADQTDAERLLNLFRSKQSPSREWEAGAEGEEEEDMGGEEDESPLKSSGDRHAKYADAKKNFEISNSQIDKLERAVYDYKLGKGDLETFMDILSTMDNPDEEVKAEVYGALETKKGKGLAAYVQAFNTQNTMAFKKAKERKISGGKPVPTSFEYQKVAPQMGYAAASGLRQSFIRDIMGVRALNAFVATKDVQSYVYNSIKEAFLDAFELPANKAFLQELFDEEGLDEYKAHINDPGFLKGSKLFQNFAGAVTYEALASIADLNFKPHRGIPGRKIGLAFMTEFGDENPKLRSFEEDQLEEMANRREYVDFINDILDESEKNGHRGLLTAAAAMTADDADAEEYGKYAGPAFASMKKAASVSKPPELHITDYLGKEDPMVAKIKAADRAARKASKE